MISPPRCDGGRGSWVKANLTMTLIHQFCYRPITDVKQPRVWTIRDYIVSGILLAIWDFNYAQVSFLAIIVLLFLWLFLNFMLLCMCLSLSHPSNSILYIILRLFFVKIGSSCNFNLKSCEMWSNFVEELTRKVWGCGSVVQAAWDSLFGLRVWVPL